MSAVAKQPVTAAIAADSLQLYTEGIHDQPCRDGSVNHAVLVVGYGEENGTPYWKVKNSWGVTWGESGYFRVKRDQSQYGNLCIHMQPIYPQMSSFCDPQGISFGHQLLQAASNPWTITALAAMLLFCVWGCIGYIKLRKGHQASSQTSGVSLGDAPLIADAPSGSGSFGSRLVSGTSPAPKAKAKAKAQSGGRGKKIVNGQIVDA